MDSGVMSVVSPLTCSRFTCRSLSAGNFGFNKVMFRPAEVHLFCPYLRWHCFKRYLLQKPTSFSASECLRSCKASLKPLKRFAMKCLEPSRLISWCHRVHLELRESTLHVSKCAHGLQITLRTLTSLKQKLVRAPSVLMRSCCWI